MRNPLLQSLNRLTNLSRHLQTRKMSTLIQYLIVVKDFPGTKQKRIEIREQHLAAVKNNTHVKAGGTPIPLPQTRYPPIPSTQAMRTQCLTIGAFFSKDPTPEDPMPFAVRPS